MSSGFGRELTRQLLAAGDRVVGTVRDTAKVADLAGQHPGTFIPELLEMTDTTAIRQLTGRCWQQLGRIDVIVSNAGLFGAAEELSDAEVTDIIATNLTGPITLIRSAVPHLRQQGGGRIIQISSYGGQVAFPGNSLYHATKWGIGNPAHAFQRMLDPVNGLAPGDPARMAAQITDSASTDPAPLRIVLGSQALASTLDTLRKRIADFETQTEFAAASDFPPGE